MKSVFAVALLLLASSVSAHTLDDVQFEQRLGASVPLNAAVRDGERVVSLSDYSQHRPILLMLVYYHCPNFCNTLLTAMTDAVVRSGLQAGRDFEWVALSIDPRETAAQAAKTQRTLMHQAAGRSGIGDGHFVTADADAIHAIAQAVGFHYYYDTAADQYAHPAGAVVLTPSGKVSAYLYGAPFDPNALRTALGGAADFRVASPLKRVWLRCFHYDPATGQYSVAILDVLRALSALALVVFGGVMLRLRARFPKPNDLFRTFRGVARMEQQRNPRHKGFPGFRRFAPSSELYGKYINTSPGLPTSGARENNADELGGGHEDIGERGA